MTAIRVSFTDKDIITYENVDEYYAHSVTLFFIKLKNGKQFYISVQNIYEIKIENA